MNPRGVAFVGDVDHQAPQKLLANLRERFGESFELVNPAGGSVAGRPVYRSVVDVPGLLDLAVIDVPARELRSVAEDCARRGVPYMLVVTGLSELGAEGLEIERQVLDVVRSNGMRMVGPNGSLNLFEPMPAAPGTRQRKIGLITQSGHMGRVILQSHRHGIAFSRWIPTGNEADLEASDFIAYLARDRETSVIAGYFEGFRNGVKLRRALALAAAEGKPVVVIKVGRHQSASRMAETHSAHLTGSDAAVDGLFRQYGVIRVSDVDELIETAALCAKLAPLPRGDGVALYGISGAAVALMADQAESHGVPVPTLSAETQEGLHSILPADLGVTNPVDPGNLYRTGTEADRRSVLRLIAGDPSIDVVVCALTGVIKGITDDFVADIVNLRDVSPKAVVATWNTWEMETPAYQALVDSGIPIFRSFRSCFGALHAIFQTARHRSMAESRGADEQRPGLSTVSSRRLGPAESATLLSRYGIRVARGREVAGAPEAAAAALEIGLPVALKAHIPETAHKSDLGLVRLGLTSTQEVEAAYAELSAAARTASRSGEFTCEVQEQLAAGTELIVGMVSDPVLGPALLVGAGGILVEVHEDVSLRPLPVTRLDVEEMLGELRCYAALSGVRGRPPADIPAIVDLLLNVARAISDVSAGIQELDLNPVIVGPAGAVAVDSVVIVGA